jgi:hypothetical protein
VKGEEPWFGRTVIRSCAKLDYGTAQALIDGACISIDQYSRSSTQLLMKVQAIQSSNTSQMRPFSFKIAITGTVDPDDSGPEGWDPARRPDGQPHTPQQVRDDLRLMHQVGRR